MELVRGSPSACEERLLSKFREAFRADPLATCLVVPTQAMARHLHAKLKKDIETVPKASVTTLDDLARSRLLASPNAPNVLSRYATESILRQIMSTRKNDLSLFVADGELRQGLVPEVRAFIATMLDFKADYPSILKPELTTKTRQLSLIRDTYLEAIHKAKQIDQHELLSWAARDLRETRKVWVKHLFLYGLFEPNPSEKEFISELCSSCPDASFFAVYDGVNPVFSGSHAWLEPTATEDLPPSDRDRAVFDIFRAKSRSPNADITVGSFADARAEMRAVASEIRGLLDSGVEPSRIAVLLPMRENAAPLVREILEDFRIPANIRVPVAFSEPLIVQTVLNVLEVVDEDYDTDVLVALLASPHIRFKYADGSEKRTLDEASVRSLAKKAKIAGGADRWEKLAVDPSASSLSASEEYTRSGVLELIKLLNSLQGEKKLADHIKSLRKACERLELGKHMYFKDPAVKRRNKRALRNYHNLMKDVENAANLYSKEPMDLKTFIGLHRGLIASEEYYPDPSLENAVKVLGLRAGQLLDFDHVFIPGMVEKDIPRVRVLNPFIPEPEVKDLGLLTHEDILRHERYYFMLALLSSSGPIFLSAHRSKEEKPTLKSMFLESVEAAIDCRRAEEEDLARSLEGLQRLVGKAISGEKVNMGCRPQGLELNDACLAINVEEFKRDGPYRTEYDGHLGGNEALSDIARFHADHVYSAKQLNMFCFCPFRYYLTYHLHMSPQIEYDEAAPVNTGRFVHRVLQRFYQERCSGGRPKMALEERDYAVADLRRIAMEEGRGGSSIGWKAYLDYFCGFGQRGMACVFIDHELKDKLPRMHPRWLELSFGSRTLEPGVDPASATEPVPIPLDDDGWVMKLACRVDRADADIRGLFFVLDYKTGSPMRKCQAVTDVQIPLYMLALEAAMPGSRGIGGGFYYLGSRKNTKIVPVMRDRDYMDMTIGAGKLDARREWDRDRLDSFRTTVLPGWLDSMNKGFFNASRSGLMAPGKDCGPVCEYYGTCRFDKARTLEMGLASEDEDEEGGDEE